MISHSIPTKTKGDRQSPRHLEDLYQKLTVCLDIVCEQLLYIEHSGARSCLIVLEDDLNALLAEVEDMMLEAVIPERKLLHSLRVRTETVINELKDLLRD